MNSKKEYIINVRTSALVSKFDHYGNERTLVFEGALTFLVDLPPDKIVEKSYQYIGRSLKGAISGARHILRKSYKVPIAYSIKHDIILIHCYRPKNVGKVWLVNSHIHQLVENDNKQCTVITKFGHRIPTCMKVSKLQDKRNQATFLHKELLYRSNIDPLKDFDVDKNHEQNE